MQGGAKNSMIWAGLGAGVLFVALAVVLREGQVRAVEAVRQNQELQGATPPKDVGEVSRALASMKLVTVEVETKVKVRRGEESWRGDVLAEVEAPVKLLFGTDLSRMKVSGAAWSPVTGAYVVRVPRPERIGTEVYGEMEKTDVQTGWARMRSRAGEYYLGQARRDVSKAAREMTLRAEDARRVEDSTRERVAAMVRSIVGERIDVVVVLEDDAGPARAAADGE